MALSRARKNGCPPQPSPANSSVLVANSPARVVASYAKKRHGPTEADIGFVQQAQMFDEVADWLGRAPVLIDSADIRANPQQMLIKLCDALAIPFTERMLHWSAGSKPYDGTWAPHWYGAIHQSTGFDSAEGPLPNLQPDDQRLADTALPHYDRLAAYKL